eukprot:2567351-Rhodomonas_salina.1
MPVTTTAAQIVHKEVGDSTEMTKTERDSEVAVHLAVSREDISSRKPGGSELKSDRVSGASDARKRVPSKNREHIKGLVRYGLLRA